MHNSEPASESTPSSGGQAACTSGNSMKSITAANVLQFLRDAPVANQTLCKPVTGEQVSAFGPHWFDISAHTIAWCTPAAFHTGANLTWPLRTPAHLHTCSPCAWQAACGWRPEVDELEDDMTVIATYIAISYA
eukprot:2569188-Pyramimonas_sp.AAC.1